jgi:K+-transporting ATPase ATPase C chain
MMRNLTRALAATVILAVLFGLVYPLAMTGLAQLVFHSKAQGSVLTVDGRAIGSRLIGQKWRGAQWFYGRPSVNDYNAGQSGGANLGPTSKELADEIRNRAQEIIAVEQPYVAGLTVAGIPVDLLTASASGLDPDISPAAAEFQATRIAAVRHLPLEEVRALIRRSIRHVPLDLFSAPSVNVLELNLALEQTAR